MFQKYLRGQVWVYTPLEDKSIGYDTNVQTSKRPCVILSNNVANYHSGTLVVAPCTTALKTNIPTHVKFKNVENGLVNVVMLEQIVTIDKRQMSGYMGMLDKHTMGEIEEAIKVSLGLVTPPGMREDGVSKPKPEKADKPDVVEYRQGNTATGDAIDYMREFVETCENKGRSKAAELYGFTEETAKSYYYRYRKKLKEIDSDTDKTAKSSQG